MLTFCVWASKPPMLSGSRVGPAVSGVGTFVWNDEILPTLHCAPEVGSLRITVSENATEDGRAPNFAAGAVLPGCIVGDGEVTHTAWPGGFALAFSVSCCAGVTGQPCGTGLVVASKPLSEVARNTSDVAGPSGLLYIGAAIGAGRKGTSDATDGPPDRRFRNIGFSRYPSISIPGKGRGSGPEGGTEFSTAVAGRAKPEGVAGDDGTMLLPAAALSDSSVLADMGNGFLGIMLLALSLLDRGEIASSGRCGAASKPSCGASRWI
jgi:hypothetical protein